MLPVLKASQATENLSRRSLLFTSRRKSQDAGTLSNSFTLDRRMWLKALGTVAAPFFIGNVIFGSNEDEHGTKVINMLDQKIQELEKDDKEKEIVRLLKTYKSKFNYNGEVTANLRVPIATVYTYHREEPNSIVLDEITPKIHPEAVKSFWDIRKLPYITDTFVGLCLKEAVYLDEYQKEPDVAKRRLERPLELVKALTEIPEGKSGKELFLDLAKNSELVASAKQFLMSIAHREYISDKPSLEFLYRREIHTKSARQEMKHNLALFPDDFINTVWSSNQDRLSCVSPDGKLEEEKYKRGIIRNTLIALEKIPSKGSLAHNPLKSAFHIVLATHPDYAKTENILEIFDNSDLFKFAYSKP